MIDDTIMFFGNLCSLVLNIWHIKTRPSSVMLTLELLLAGPQGTYGLYGLFTLDNHKFFFSFL